MVIFNFIGLAMLAVAFAVGFSISALAHNEPAFMVAIGPVLLVCDLWYRQRRQRIDPQRWWYRPTLGGQLFFAPIWTWGIFWMLLGTYRLLTEHPL